MQSYYISVKQKQVAWAKWQKSDDDIFKWSSLKTNVYIFIETSLTFVPHGPIDKEGNFDSHYTIKYFSDFFTALVKFTTMYV